MELRELFGGNLEQKKAINLSNQFKNLSGDKRREQKVVKPPISVSEVGESRDKPYIPSSDISVVGDDGRKTFKPSLDIFETRKDAKSEKRWNSLSRFRRDFPAAAIPGREPT